jgi:peptidoglycan/LPS O-acetylase OafA/YrhL
MAPFWKFLTFTTNFGLDFKHAGAFSHSWSLCVEEHFYLILPALVIAMSGVKARKWVPALVASVFIAGMCTRMTSWFHFLGPLQANRDNTLWYVTYFKTIYYPSYNRLDGLLIGVTIAMIYRFRPILWEKLTSLGNFILLLGIAFLSGAYFLCENETSFGASVFGYPLLALGFGSLVIAGLSPHSILAKMRIPGAETMAMLSFTFYLTHKEIIHLLHRRFTYWGWNCDSIPVFFATFVVCFMASVLLHITVEKPFLNLRDTVLKKPV